MTINNVVDFGKSKGACVEALRWLSTQTDAEQAWLTCERPDWMIWYAARRGVDRNVLVRIACDCARTALRFVPAGEDRPRIAIETTERWIAGEATIAEVRLTPPPTPPPPTCGVRRISRCAKLCAITLVIRTWCYDPRD